MPATRLGIDARQPALVLPSVNLAYAPFPNELPEGTPDEVWEIYREFLSRRDELVRFGVEPTLEGYHAWSSVLARGRDSEAAL